MGAGKSTIGRLLAKELHLDFKDSDKEIEQRCGANIPWIFDVEGEAGFRERESAMLAELCDGDGVVIATGMTVGTLFTLFVLPCVYTLVAKKDLTPEGDPSPAH